MLGTGCALVARTSPEPCEWHTEVIDVVQHGAGAPKSTTREARS